MNFYSNSLVDRDFKSLDGDNEKIRQTWEQLFSHGQLVTFSHIYTDDIFLYPTFFY